MTTSAAIRSAWQTGLWGNATILDFTTKIYAYDVIASLRSVSEIELLMFEQKINFFSYLVTRETILDEIGNGPSKYKHVVQVHYYLQKEIADDDQNFNAVVDRLETVDGLILSQLGKTWSSTVSYYSMTGIKPPELIQVDGVDTWRAGYEYTAFSLT